MTPIRLYIKWFKLGSKRQLPNTQHHLIVSGVWISLHGGVPVVEDEGFLNSNGGLKLLEVELYLLEVGCRVEESNLIFLGGDFHLE